MSAAELDRIAALSGFHVVVYGQVKLGFTSPRCVQKVVRP